MQGERDIIVNWSRDDIYHQTIFGLGCQRRTSHVQKQLFLNLPML
jgi:hypothetical protein